MCEIFEVEKGRFSFIKGLTQKPRRKEEAPMKVKISLPEVVSLFKEIQHHPEKLFKMIRMDMQEKVGEYISKPVEVELTHFLCREPYEQKGEEDPNYRNGSYDRSFTFKVIGP